LAWFEVVNTLEENALKKHYPLAAIIIVHPFARPCWRLFFTVPE
jgi:hypothetical protein